MGGTGPVLGMCRRERRCVVSLRTCPECGKAAPPTHFYPKSGKPRCIPHLKWPLARRWKVMTMIEQGRSNAQIAKVMGIRLIDLEAA